MNYDQIMSVSEYRQRLVQGMQTKAQYILDQLQLVYATLFHCKIIYHGVCGTNITMLKISETLPQVHVCNTKSFL